MAACSPWKYKNVTPAVFQALRTLGKQKGFAIPSAPSGKFTIQVAGLQAGFQYKWNSGDGTLVLVCEKKPALVSCSVIKNYADQIVSQCGGKAA
jgi:hypothetical protein